MDRARRRPGDGRTSVSLNEYGLRVTSAAVLRDPPTVDELPADMRDSASGDASQMRLIVGLGGAMLLVITALLVGPAFAVSAARQRRTLALAASNGASTPVLRRTVLAQALVLGAPPPWRARCSGLS